jgi:YHS domain-containing protein
MKMKILLALVAVLFATSAIVKAQENNCCKDKQKSECKMNKEECKMNKSDCKMSKEECKMSKEECKMEKSDCKMNKEDCKMNKPEVEKTGNAQGSGVTDSAKLCPVSGEVLGHEGEPVKFTYLGKEYEFCCAGCVKKFKAEPMSYIKTELTCPVMGEAASKDVSTVVDGVKYYFCCSGCIAKFEKDPKKYLDKVK